MLRVLFNKFYVIKYLLRIPAKYTVLGLHINETLTPYFIADCIQKSRLVVSNAQIELLNLVKY